LARSLVGRDERKEGKLLDQLKAGAQEALENPRDLAKGIFPPLPADDGLVAALTTQTRKSAVPVSVEADGIGQFSQDAYATIHFCALEALQNVAKYAKASGRRSIYPKRMAKSASRSPTTASASTERREPWVGGYRGWPTNSPRLAATWL